MTYKFGIPSTPAGTVTDVGGVQSTDASTGVVFSVTLNTAGTNTLENPTNLQEGQKYTWQLKQDAVTPVDVTFGTDFLFTGGTAPTITQVAGAVDIVRATALDDGTGNIKLYSKFEANVKAVATPPAYSNTYSMELVQASSQYCALGSTSALDKSSTDPFSISLWVRPTAALTGTLALISKMAGSGALNGYALYYYGGNLYMHFRGNATGDQVFYNVGSSYLSVGSWAHIAMIYESTTVAKIYIDGVDRTPASSGTLTVSMSNAASFKVGAFTGPNSYIDAMVDELSFWDKALSSGEVTSIYNSGTPTDLTGSSDLVSWWRFGDDASDDFTGGIGQIIDQVGSNNLIPYNTTSANKVTNVP